MTDNDAVARSIAAKLDAFEQTLTPEEREFIAQRLQAVLPEPDVQGYGMPILSTWWLQHVWNAASQGTLDGAIAQAANMGISADQS